MLEDCLYLFQNVLPRGSTYIQKNGDKILATLMLMAAKLKGKNKAEKPTSEPAKSQLFIPPNNGIFTEIF